MDKSRVNAAGWYPDESTGGTQYWDGRRWTGDRRPVRRQFAASYANRGWGIGLVVVGALSILSSPGQFSQPQTENSSPPIVLFFFAILIGIGLIAWGVYLLRGQGPSTKSVIARLEAERARSGAQFAPPPRAPQQSTSTININVSGNSASESAAAAQVKAIADPETAQALLNLQKLLYSRTISDAEYQAAKNKLLGDM